MHEFLNKLAAKSFAKYFVIFVLPKCPPLVDCHETNLKIQRKIDQDKLERRHILKTEEQLKDHHGYEGSNEIKIGII